MPVAHNAVPKAICIWLLMYQQKKPPRKTPQSQYRPQQCHSCPHHSHCAVVCTAPTCGCLKDVSENRRLIKSAWDLYQASTYQRIPQWLWQGRRSAVYCVKRHDIIRLTLSQKNWRRTVLRIMKWNSIDLYIVMIYTYTIIWHCRWVLFSGQVVVAHRESTRLSRRSPVVQHCNYFQKSFSL